jgi:hypothetical protein
VIEPVSAENLCKTGISADGAGDFRRFPPHDRRTWSPEANPNARKARICGLFSCLLGSRPKRRTGWLPREGSTSDIPNYVSAFEISREFHLESLVFMPGDFSAFSQSKWEHRDPP